MIACDRPEACLGEADPVYTWYREKVGNFEMEDFMAKVKPGDTVKLEVFRKGRLVDITLVAVKKAKN